MANALPYEVISSQDTKQWTGNNGTFQAYDLTAKNEAGETVLVNINRKPTNPPPTPGETIWLEVWETEYGLKGRKKAGPRQQSVTYTQGDDSSRDRSIIRQHSQHMALLFAQQVDLVGDPPELLRTIEAWTDHFDADVQRASGTQESSPATSQPSPAPQASNGGEPTITPNQITGFILRKQKMHGISDENMALLVKSFGVEKLKDLPRSRVDEFAEAMTNPIPDDSSDVPEEFIPSAASEADDEIPF